MKPSELNLLTAEEVAAALKCSPRVISEQAEKRWEGFPRARRIGRLKRWVESEVAEWVRKRA